MHLSCRITSNSLSFKNHELEWFHRCSFRRINELICFIQTIIIVLYFAIAADERVGVASSCLQFCQQLVSLIFSKKFSIKFLLKYRSSQWFWSFNFLFSFYTLLIVFLLNEIKWIQLRKNHLRITWKLYDNYN